MKWSLTSPICGSPDPTCGTDAGTLRPLKPVARDLVVQEAPIAMAQVLLTDLPPGSSFSWDATRDAHHSSTCRWQRVATSRWCGAVSKMHGLGTGEGHIFALHFEERRRVRVELHR